MRIRLAKPSDHKLIAEIHYVSRSTLSKGFFASVPRAFLNAYYRILLDSDDFFALCVENEEKRICGFVTATLRAEEHYATLKKNKFFLSIALMPGLILNPALLHHAYRRYKSTQNLEAQQFVTLSGARGEFWVWDTRLPSSGWAVKLYQAHLKVLASIGVSRLGIEVDVENKKILKFHNKNGARLDHSFELPDGRERLLMFYEFE